MSHISIYMRRCVCFGIKGRSRKLSLDLLRVISFPCISEKTSPLMFRFLIQIHVTSFSETIKLTSQEFACQRWHTLLATTCHNLRKESRKPHCRCFIVHLILITEVCRSSGGERTVRGTLVLTPPRWEQTLSCWVTSLPKACGLCISCAKSLLSKARVLHSWLQVRSSLTSSCIRVVSKQPFLNNEGCLTEDHIFLLPVLISFHMDPQNWRYPFLFLKKKYHFLLKWLPYFHYS